MKHKKQLRKSQDERKAPGEMERTADNCSERDGTDRSAQEELKHGMEPDSYVLEENDDEEEDEDDVDIEDDVCSPDHLL